MKSEEISVVYLLEKHLFNKTLTEEQEVDACFIVMKYPYLIDDFISILAKVEVYFHLLRMGEDSKFINIKITLSEKVDVNLIRDTIKITIDQIFSMIAISEYCSKNANDKALEKILDEDITAMANIFIHSLYGSIEDTLNKYDGLVEIIKKYYPPKENLSAYIIASFIGIGFDVRGKK